MLMLAAKLEYNLPLQVCLPFKFFLRLVAIAVIIRKCDQCTTGMTYKPKLLKENRLRCQNNVS